MANHAVSAVPVVDNEGHVLGIVSEADLLYKAEYAARPAHRDADVGVAQRRGVVDAVTGHRHRVTLGA